MKPKKKLTWFAAAPFAGIKRMGPYPTQVRAWEAVRLHAEAEKEHGLVHAAGAYVWCEEGKR